MTQYSIIIQYELTNFVASFKTRNFTSVVQAKLALAEIEESLENARRFEAVRRENGYARTLSDMHLPQFKLLSIGLFYKADGEWMQCDPAKFCNRCGRLLTDQESIRLGYGPECAQKINASRISIQFGNDQSVLEDF